MEAARDFEQDRREDSSGTLGDVLYANKSTSLVAEEDWVGLVRSIAAGDQLALHALYERTHHLVYILIVRIIRNRETAEELTLEVFYDIWRRAARYDAEDGTVLGWIMNQARSRALRFEQRKRHVDARAGDQLLRTVKARIRSGLHKLRQAWTAEGKRF